MVVNHWYTIIIHPNHQFVNQGDKENERKNTLQPAAIAEKPYVPQHIQLVVADGLEAHTVFDLRNIGAGCVPSVNEWSG